MSTPTLKTRLPEVGTTIFTVMSQLAVQHDAVNLGQGFPDFPCDERLQALVTEAMRAGHNQYAPMSGVAGLREAIAQKTARLYGRAYDPGAEITVTAGATQAIMGAILACVHPGDEVIALEPCYDSYIPGVRLAGGVPVLVALNPGDYSVPWEKVRAAISPRTRLILLNSPHNPSGAVFSAADLDALEALVCDTRILLLGAGEIGEKTAKAFQSRGAAALTVASRRFERAMELATALGASAMPFEQREARLAEYDIVVCATSAPEIVVSISATLAAMQQRPARPLFFIDQALPRDVDPAVASIENVFLYNLDDLAKIAEENRVAREAEINKCRAIVTEKAEALWRQVAAQVEGSAAPARPQQKPA